MNAKSTPDFETFMKERVPENQRPIIEAFRQLVRDVAPEVSEGMRGGTEAYYSVPVYRLNRDIIAISPSKTALTFSFSKGASFKDTHGLLGGAGKTSRTVRVKTMDDFPEAALADYIRQAVAEDQ